jgi:hypothetical protein
MHIRSSKLIADCNNEHQYTKKYKMTCIQTHADAWELLLLQYIPKQF